jgi:hypothetical protein
VDILNIIVTALTGAERHRRFRIGHPHYNRNLMRTRRLQAVAIFGVKWDDMNPDQRARLVKAKALLTAAVKAKAQAKLATKERRRLVLKATRAKATAARAALKAARA